MYSEYIFGNNGLESLEVDSEWCFKNVKSTEQYTHGYHRYPAKFLPNIVKKLILNYSREGDTVADLFAGCGTTLVEAKLLGRKSIGVDINPVAKLIAKVKITAIPPEVLEENFSILATLLEGYSDNFEPPKDIHSKLQYWFNEDNTKKLYFLISCIEVISNPDVKDFFLVGLSNILKNSSKWLQTSTKPQIDPNKKPADPFEAFRKQCTKMIKKNNEYYDYLKFRNYLQNQSAISVSDARNTTIAENSIDVIITSPPYVTSYEYADIHQLTGYLFKYIEDLPKFRKSFIGSFYSGNIEFSTNTSIGSEIIEILKTINKRTAREVASYFNDLGSVIKEMGRILKKDGHACVVVGNTTYKGVKIKSAEIIAANFLLYGFNVEKIIKRTIPHKLIPTIRDPETGRFSNLANKNSKQVYPEEYIIIVKKK